MNPFRRKSEGHTRLQDEVEPGPERNPFSNPFEKERRTSRSSPREGIDGQGKGTPGPAHAARPHPGSKIVFCTNCQRRFQVAHDCPSFYCTDCGALLAVGDGMSNSRPTPVGGQQQINVTVYAGREKEKKKKKKKKAADSSSDSSSSGDDRSRRRMQKRIEQLEAQMNSTGSASPHGQKQLGNEPWGTQPPGGAASSGWPSQDTWPQGVGQLQPAAAWSATSNASAHWASSASSASSPPMLPLQGHAGMQGPAPWPNSPTSPALPLQDQPGMQVSAPWPNSATSPNMMTLYDKGGSPTGSLQLMPSSPSSNNPFGNPTLSGSPTAQQSTLSFQVPSAMNDMSSEQLLMMALAKRNMEMQGSG